MRKLVISFAAVAALLLMASCGGNKGGNANAEAADEKEAAPEVAYEQFTVEKYNVSIDYVKGMRRTDDPVMDNGAIWTLVPEDGDDWPIFASLSIGVYEAYEGEYTDEKIQKAFDEDIPAEAEKKLDLEKKEYTYGIPSETVSEYHRVFFKGNLEVNVTVSYSPKWEPQLGGEVRDHIMNSAKFN